MGGWGILERMGRFLGRGLRLGFVIWAGITLFWAVAPVRALAWVNDGCFGVVFDHGRMQGGDWGDW